MCKTKREILVQSYLAQLQQKTRPGEIEEASVSQSQLLSKDQAGLVGYRESSLMKAASWVDRYLDDDECLDGDALPDAEPNVGTGDAMFFTRVSSLPSIQEEAAEHGEDKKQSFLALMPETCKREQWQKMGFGKRASKSSLKSRVYKTVSQLFSWSSSVRRTVPNIIVEDLIKQQENEIISWWESELSAKKW